MQMSKKQGPSAAAVKFWLACGINILYDEENPSAIVNLNGMDHFVKAGDVVSGYTIDSITKDKVQVSYKNNSYVASVGELFTRGSLDKQRAVVNLENKFAGRYKNNN